MKKIYFSRLWRLMLLCCIAITSQAQTVNIKGYKSVDKKFVYPLFIVSEGNITVSSSYGSFNYIYIDDTRIASNSSPYWSSYSIDITPYCDGNIHKLQLTSGSSNYGICYITSNEEYEDLLVDGIYYSIRNEAAIVTVALHNIEDAIIHETYTKDGVTYPVVAISSSAFSGCTSLTDITIPESVTSIGNSAFYGCTSLTDITIPEYITSIGESTFKKCTNLTSLTFNAVNCSSCGSSSSPAFPSTISTLTIGDKVTKIPDYFLDNGSKIESLVIPNSVTSIGSHAFSNSTSLTGIVIPKSVTSIGSYAFYGCTSLTDITIPESITSIGNYAFYGCTNLTSLTFNAVNCSSCGSSSFSAFPSTISTLTIGDKVTKIPDYFLEHGSKIESLVIPNSVTSIGSYAFYNSNSLQSLTLGSGLLSIGKYAFTSVAKAFWLGNTPPSGYNNVRAEVNYVANNQYSMNNQLQYQFLSSMFEVDGVKYIPVSPSDRTCDVVDCVYTGDYRDITISDKVTNKGVEMSVININQYAFYGNHYLNSLKIGNGIKTIGNSAFYGCSALKDIVIPNSIESLGSSAFQKCSSLASASIGKGIPSLPESIFSGCSSLGSLSIPNNISSIGDYAFSGCSSLGDITIEDGKKANDKLTLGSNGSNPLFSKCPLDEVYIGRKLSYKTSSSYGYSPFYRNTSLRTVEITDAETEIYDNEFYGCTNLNSLKIGNGVKTIGNSAFYDCSALKDVVIPDSVKSLGSSAFRNCSSLESVSIGTGIPSLPTYTFSGCSSLGSLSIPNNISSIGDYAFSGCSSLGDITIEDGKKADDKLTLGSNGSNPLFSKCPLDEVYIGRKLSYKTSSSYGYSPFYRNTSLRTVEITDAETEIYDNEFYGCTNLNSLKIGNGVKTIGNWAFSGCSSLDYFSAGNHVESIGKEAFSDCTGLTKYYSYSAVPPVCGDQALDDINKWECTLYVPNESSDEYQAAAQWKDFFFVEEMDAVLVAEILLNVTEATLDVDETIQLTADILPSNATDMTLVWSSSDNSVATVDADGFVTAIAEGSVVITVRSKDGNAEATCSIAVNSKQDTGIDDVVSETHPMTIWTNDKTIIIAGKNPQDRVNIYNVQGTLVESTNADKITLSQSGVFVVRIGNYTCKVIF